MITPLTEWQRLICQRMHVSRNGYRRRCQAGIRANQYFPPMPRFSFSFPWWSYRSEEDLARLVFQTGARRTVLALYSYRELKYPRSYPDLFQVVPEGGSLTLMCLRGARPSKWWPRVGFFFLSSTPTKECYRVWRLYRRKKAA